MLTNLMKNKLAVLWLGFFTFMVFVGNIVLPDIMSADSNYIQNMAEGFVEPGDTSFKATAFFFSLFPSPLDVVLILVVGWVSLSLLMMKLKTPQANLLAYYMTFPAMLTCMIRPQKETIVIILAITVAWLVMGTQFSKLKKFVMVAGIYTLYALFFRQYFFLIIAAFAAVYLVIESRRGLIAVLVGLLGVGAVLVMPIDILYDLQYPRDMVNYGRVGTGLAGHRTAFMNPYPIDSGWNFLLNYIYVFIRMNLPFVFDLSPKAWFWFGAIVTYVYVMVKGLKNSSDEMRMLVSLFLGHMCTLLLFEPDTGSYTRHITSVFVYMTPALMAVDEYFYTKRA